MREILKNLQSAVTRNYSKSSKLNLEKIHTETARINENYYCKTMQSLQHFHAFLFVLRGFNSRASTQAGFERTLDVLREI